MEDRAVKMEQGTGLIHCHFCGRRVRGEYQAQDPAPCGCAWVWENGRLVAAPSDAEDRRPACHPVVAAQLIRPYVGPQWLIEPVGEPSDAEDLAAISRGYSILAGDLAGWGEYTHVIEVANSGAHYLARLGG